MRNLFDKAIFWGPIGGAVVVIGGILIGVGAAIGTTARPLKSVWDVPWFIAGVVVGGLGILALLWALVLYVAHGHFESHVAELRAQSPVQIHASPQSGVAIYTGTATAPASPQASPSIREGWVPPDQLGEYLKSINQTMESHGFGRDPNLLSAPPSPDEDRRAKLIVKGLEVRGQLFTPNPFGGWLSRLGNPAVTQWMQEAQAYLYEKGSELADVASVRGYSDKAEAVSAIDTALEALRRLA